MVKSIRTAGYGPVCPVVWEGGGREAAPYPDLFKIEHFFDSLNDVLTATTLRSFSPEAVEDMIKSPWKGNVRELRNVVERLLIMTDRDVIEKKDLPEQIIGEHLVYLPEPDKVKTLKDFRDMAEKDFILAKLEQNNWNISQTAREIDTPRSNLYKKLEQFGIKITAGVGEAVAPGSSEEE